MSARDWIDEHRAELDSALNFLQDHAQTVETWARALAERLPAGSRMLAAGNGGSAAEAQHLTSELVGRFLHDRQSFSAISLCAESSSVSAIVNDYGADEMFARQVDGHGRPGDVLVLLSTSGTSPNVLRAAERGRALGMTVWGLTGPAPNPLAELCHDALCVDAPSTAAVQEGHLVAIHALCAALDRHLGVTQRSSHRQLHLSQPSPDTPHPSRRVSEAQPDTPRHSRRQQDPSQPHPDIPHPSRRQQDPSRPHPLADASDGTRPHVVVVGDVLLDADVDGDVERLCPDAPAPVLDVRTTRYSPGGAGLAALLCTGRVTLVTPIGDDEHGDRLAAELEQHLTLVRLPHEGDTRRKIRVRTGGRSLLRIDDGGPGRPGDVPVDAVAAVLASADAVLVSDYGAGTTHHPELRRLLADAARRTRVVWDPHPRGGQPVPGAVLVTPNLSEARAASERPDAAADVVAGALRATWQARGVCVTTGADGAFLAAHDDEASYFPAVPALGGDACGAGDQFAATATSALAAGALLSQAVESAVADASAWVAAGGAEGFRARRQPTGAGVGSGGDAGARLAANTDQRPGGVLGAEPDALHELATRLRSDGSTVVATGGCFDIVHAGHVATLQAARRLGDRLVVLMNSDESVTRLKGPGRPVVPAADRARVLEALDCVDAVVVFDDDDPRGALTHLRPDIWAKGGDYGGRPLPETEIVQEHGGRVVLLPYLGGRSTTSIINRSERAVQAAEHARARGGAA